MKMVAGQPYVSKKESDELRLRLCLELSRIGTYAASLRWWNVRKRAAFMKELGKLRGYAG